jgi:hypothetical protein
MSESRFSSRGVGAAGATSTAGFLRTVNLSDAAAIFLASIALVGAQRNDALLLTDLSGGGGELLLPPTGGPAALGVAKGAALGFAYMHARTGR